MAPSTTANTSVATQATPATRATQATRATRSVTKQNPEWEFQVYEKPVKTKKKNIMESPTQAHIQYTNEILLQTHQQLREVKKKLEECSTQNRIMADRLNILEQFYSNAQQTPDKSKSPKRAKSPSFKHRVSCKKKLAECEERTHSV